MNGLRFLRSLAALRHAGRNWLFREASPPSSPAAFAPPSELRFECGRFPFARTVRYRIKRGWIERVVRLPGWTNADPVRHRRQPTPEQWREFWQTIEPLRIWAWQPMYFNPPRARPYVLDGAGWFFSCRRGPQRVKSRGGRYYPKLWRPQETDFRGDSIALLRMALDTLLSAFPHDSAAHPGNLAAGLRLRPPPPPGEPHGKVPDQ